MKILIINQHTGNHGDEAAGKALLRGLREQGISDNISIFYNVKKLLDIEKLDIDENIRHHVSIESTFIDKILLILTFILPFFIVKRLYRFGKLSKYEYNFINQFDEIINAPGGVNMGPYKDWRYIWRLYISIKMKKKVAIYSISFGPLPDSYLFKKVSYFILKNVKFLSLRDRKSQEYADQLSVDYIPSIDTAFLNNQPAIIIPEEMTNLLVDTYIVVVPNQLNKWHPNYQSIEENSFDNIYLSIINYFITKKINIVLLPQLFGHMNDIDYFQTLKEKSDTPSRVIVIDEKYSSDIQQKIINQAEFLVGARYHTIIFSINNKKPFVSLAYEHKMTNTLELIDLDENNIEIKKILNNDLNVIDFIEEKYSIFI